MRELLSRLVQPMVDRLAADLVDALATRVEAQLLRVGEACDVAVSAFISEAPHDDSDRRDHDPLPHVRRSSGRGLHNDEPRRQERANPSAGNGMPAPRTQEADQGRANSEPAARLVDKRVRDYKPDNYPPSRRDRDDRAAPQANGKRAVTCSKCGFVGGNVRGCGKSHPTQSRLTADDTPQAAERRLEERRSNLGPPPRSPQPISDDDGKRGSRKPAPHETQQGAATPGHRASEAAGNVAESRRTLIGHHDAGPSSTTFTREKSLRSTSVTAVEERRLSPTPQALAAAKERIARIASRAKTTPPSARTPEPPADDNTNADEEWSPQRIAEERELAENSKHAGELPVPSSSYRVTPPPRVGEGGDVEELNFGDQG